LLRSLAVRLSKYLDIPSWGHGHTSSSRVDEQASDEKTINVMLIANARPSLLGGLGGLANVTLTSYESLVMDNERFGALKRVMQGIAIDDEHLAYPVIADIANGHNVITHDHTLKYLRGSEVWKPKLAQREGLVNGKPVGLSMKEQAREEVKYIIENHKVEPLNSDIKDALDEILKDYDSGQLRFPK
jgi:trimethylamine--corrinoid protein Co-methyltransferase